MGKILVIGSAVADVIIRLEDHLPVKGEDVHVLSQEMRLGGCAFNVYDMIRHFKEPAVPFLPVGTGPYGDFVGKALRERGIVSAAPQPDAPNGCCYCFIEADGERTFIVYHGAEYRFKKEWFDALNTEEIDMCYICGLEIEEATGPVIVDFLERNPQIRIVFAPGPRIMKIDPALMKRLFALHPILHLNEQEALALSDSIYPGQMPDTDPDHIYESLLPHARAVCGETGGDVIITLGSSGCMYCTCGHQSGYVPAYPARQTDTNGAGDSHAGTLIALLHAGAAMEEALDMANRVAAAVVSTPGAVLSDEAFQEIKRASEENI